MRRKRWWVVVGLCLAGLVALPLAAQEDLPAPEKRAAAEQGAGRARPTREERRERRRRIVRGLLDQLQPAAPSQQSAPQEKDGPAEKTQPRGKKEAERPEAERPAAAPLGGLLQGIAPLFSAPAGPGGPPPAPLDAGKLNRAIGEELTGPLVRQLENIEALELRFEQDQTDFPADRLGVTAHVRLKSAPWGTPADLHLHLSSGMGGNSLRQGRGLLKVRIDLSTDTVALCNFLKQRALQRCYRLAGSPGAEEGQQEICRLLEATPEFTSLTDVADFIPNMGIVNLQAANRKIERLRAQMQEGGPSAPPASLVGALAKAYKARDSALAASIRIHRDPALEVPRIDVKTTRLGPATGFAEVELVDVTMTPDRVYGDLHVSIGRGGVMLYQGAKGVLIEPTLRRLQQRDPATLDRLRQGGRDIHQQLEELQAPPAEDSLPAPHTP